MKIFISYSHEDRQYRQEFEKQLSPLVRTKKAIIWSDAELSPGANWKEVIDKNLDDSDVVICLITSNFIHSDFCYNEEFLKCIDRHKRGEITIIPLIVEDCGWEMTEIGELQAIPEFGQPVHSSKWKNAAEGYADAVRRISKHSLKLSEKQIKVEVQSNVNVIIDLPDYDSSLGSAIFEILNADPSLYGSHGFVRRYENGHIYYLSKIGNPDISFLKIKTGDFFRVKDVMIGIRYESLGGTGSRLGFPISEIGEAWQNLYNKKGYIQWFEGGSIYYAEGLGAHVLFEGKIRYKFGSYEKKYKITMKKECTGGILGFPISNQECIKNFV